MNRPLEKACNFVNLIQRQTLLISDSVGQAPTSLGENQYVIDKRNKRSRRTAVCLTAWET